MTDLPPTSEPIDDDVDAALRPPSCEDLRREAEERSKSLRLLPRITRDAVRIVWAAAPSDAPGTRHARARQISTAARVRQKRTYPTPRSRSISIPG